MTDNVGTTALPVSSAGSPVRVWFDLESVGSEAQQPQTQQIANFEAKANEDCINGSTVAVNQHFVVYTVKNGLIRVLHRHSTIRTLLRGHHEERVTDCRFFQDGDVLATVGHNAAKSTIIVWRIYERPPDVAAEKMLEIVSNKTKIMRIVWHPYIANQFWMLHTNAQGRMMASLVETTRVQTTQSPSGPHQTAVFFEDYTIMKDGVTIQSSDPNLYDVTDLAWSPMDGRYLMTAHSSGEIILWDLKSLAPRGDGTMSPTQVQTLMQDPPQPLTRCIFLPHDNQANNKGNSSNPLTSCFVTASDQNATITLWSPFETNAKDGSSKKPQKIQILSLERPSPSYILDVVYSITPPEASPMSSFLVMADRHDGKILAFHLKAQWEEGDTGNKKTMLVGSDYVVPFKTRFPTFSCSVQSAPAADITEEDLVDQGGLIFDAKLFAYQSKLVQSLTLTSYMLLPPESSWVDPTPGVRVERLYSVQSAHVSVVDEDEVIETAISDFKEEQFEDYDGEEEYGEENEEKDEAANDGVAGVAGLATGNDDSLAANPFANWLGAIASKSDATENPPPLPPVVSKTAPPPGMSSPIPAQAPPQKKEFAVPIVSAPPASDLPAPSGEPMAFLSPSDFLPADSKPPVDPTPEKPKQEGSAKKSANKSGKKAKKKDQQANQDVSILKRATTPRVQSRSPKREKPTTPAISTSTQMPDIAKEIRMAVKEEMKNTVVPAIKNTIKDALDTSIVRPLQESVDSLAKQGVTVDHNQVSASLASSVDPSLRAVFAENMKTVFIPTLESVTGQILEKLSENLANSAAESNGTASKELVAMSSQLSTMTELVAELTREVQSLRSAHASSQQESVAAPNVAPRQPAPVVNQMEAMKGEILKHLAEKQFEAAFTRAVSASTAELAVFCCANADVNEVLGVPQIQLSQPIIICLMQQLGTVVATTRNSTLQVELEWLQDLAMSLDPKDKTISQHVPRVLQQLVTSINTRVAEGDPNLRRPLQRLLSIVRGIPVA